MSDQTVYLEQQEMTLLDYAAVVRRRKWLVILPTVRTNLVEHRAERGEAGPHVVEWLLHQPNCVDVDGAVDHPQ